MEYPYSLTVIDPRFNVATDSHGTVIWYNFVSYVSTKYTSSESNSDTFHRELVLWNAISDEGRNTISFRTEQDRTFFLLRFS